MPKNNSKGHFLSDHSRKRTEATLNRQIDKYKRFGVLQGLLTQKGLCVSKKNPVFGLVQIKSVATEDSSNIILCHSSKDKHQWLANKLNLYISKSV